MKKRTAVIATEEQELIRCLKGYGFSKNKVKTYVKLGYVLVNGKIVHKLPFVVKKGDQVVVDEQILENQDLNILYEDEYYLVIDKPAGLLTISTSKASKHMEDTLYKRARAYLNSKGEYVFVVNRIDKETSGVVIFVKNEELKQMLQEKWNQIVKKRGYIAIVSGKILQPGRIDNYLYEDKMTFSHSTKVGGKRAITNYCPIKRNDRYTMLDVHIETGRKNQIRVHFTEMGHPIVGDKKYYSKDNSLKRLALHHYEIKFIDPISQKLLTFKSEIPKEFYDLFH